MIDAKKFYIDGTWVEACKHKPHQVFNPASEQVVAEISVASSEDVNIAVIAARKAFRHYSEISVAERREIISRIDRVYKRRIEDLGQAISLEMGAPIDMAVRVQAPAGRSHIRATLRAMGCLDVAGGREKNSGVRVIREPIGVCALITPWNWSLNQVCSKLIPALAAGCTTVLKASEVAPLSAQILAEIIHEAEVPRGVFNLLQGDGRETGTALVRHTDVDMVSFTGSSDTAKEVSANAANTLKRVVLECGGKSPAIIFSDTDVRHAVRRTVKSCFYNTGQSCNAPTRMLVQRNVYDQALKWASEVANEIRVADPAVAGRHIGPVANATQFLRVQQFIKTGIEQGASLLIGGLGKPQGLQKGYYVRPTIFYDVHEKQQIFQEEIFGPVLCVTPFETEAQALSLANNSRYGLSASIFTEDLLRADRVARALHCGMVKINGASLGSSTPFGGYKQSGNGRENGEYGLHEFLEYKAITQAESLIKSEKSSIMESDHSNSTSISEAIRNWGNRYIPVEQLSLKINLPWMQVYSLRRGRQLKVLSAELKSNRRDLTRLAEEFPDLIPRVVASDTSLGTVITQSLVGSNSTRKNKQKQLKVITDYATMQTKLFQDKALKFDFSTLDVDVLLNGLIAFLEPDEEKKNSQSQARDFMSRSKCEDYRDALIVRKSLLMDFLQRCNHLPVTLTHGNLTLSSLVSTQNNELKIDHWEQAKFGPAGLSLHGVFDGCASVYQSCKGGLAITEVEPINHRENLLHTYIQRLAAGRYATTAQLLSALPATVAAGSIQSLLWYGYYSCQDEKYKAYVGEKLQSRLSDLLDLCDQLVLEQPNLLRLIIQDYQVNGRPGRAERILKKYCNLYPSDTHALMLLGDSYKTRTKKSRAKACYKKAMSMSTDLALDARLALAEMYLEKLELEKAASILSVVPVSADPLCLFNQLNDRIDYVKSCRAQAVINGELPTLEVSRNEYQSGVWLPEKLEVGAELFSKFGVVKIDNAFDVKFIKSCNDSFVNGYAEYFTERTHQKALRIGDKRYQIGLTLEGSFNDPQLYANAFVLPLMKRLLGKDVMIGCTVCAASLPGSKDQHWHKDHKSLFSNSSNDTPMVLPPFAITAMIPFVALNNATGTTSVIKGSQHLSNGDSELLPEQRPLVSEGSCFLMDMRLSHRGIGNRSGKVRPILNMVYQQSWFSDNKNYTKHAPLNVSKSEYKKIPKKFRSLFRWGEIKGPRVNL